MIWQKGFGIESSKDDLGLVNLNFLSHSRLVRHILHFKARKQGLESNGVVTPVDEYGRTSLDYIPCVVEAFFGKLRDHFLSTEGANGCT